MTWEAICEANTSVDNSLISPVVDTGTVVVSKSAGRVGVTVPAGVVISVRKTKQ